jgi:DNA-binding beta-propeller fold protein YncE
MRANRWISAVALTAATLSLSAAPAFAVDSVYWTDYETQAINRAGIAGGGGAGIPISGAPVEGPYGIAIDSAAGKIYWANWDANTIGVANLDGSGAALLNTGEAEVEGPAGLAIDPAGGRLYWPNEEGTKISFANLNGSGGGNLNTEGATIEDPQGIAFFPATGRVYWANNASISFADINGTGGDDIDTTGAELSNATGVAIDASTNRIFWSNFSDDSIGFVNLGGGGGGKFEIGAGGVDPEGAAVDPFENRIYFGSVSEEFLAFTSLSGGIPGLVDIAPLAAEYISFPILAKTPVNTASPVITKAPKPVPKPVKAKKGPQVQSHSETLTCSQGSWAGDLLESQLYRAPTTFVYQWLRNGAPVAGATASSLSATEVGSYACRVTAANAAGPAASPASAAVDISAAFKLGKAKVDAKKGTAKIQVAASGSGVVKLSGKGLKSRSLKKKAGGTGTLNGSLVIKATGKALKKLKENGKAKVKAKFAYTPTGGKPLKKTKSVTLRLNE